MRVLKIILTVFIALLISSALLKASGSKSAAQPELQKPEAKSIQINSLQRYKDTLIDYDNPETEWAYTKELGTYEQPMISGQAGILVDISTGNALFIKAPNNKMKIASLTKIMTAVLILEHKKLTDKVYVDRESANIGENSMGISEGETYTVEELIYGLILNSGNDAAYALSKSAAGSVPTFVEWMNYKAKELGLNDTYFADPSGLDDATYSTPYDLLKLTRYALKNQEFKNIVKTTQKELAQDTNDTEHKYLLLENQTNLLTSYPGVQGVKTGYTEEAGLCLVTYAINEGHELIGVVLNSIDRKGDMILMLDHGFNTLGIKITHNLL